MNIERNEERILIRYVDTTFKIYKCVITAEDNFVVNFCRRNLQKMEKILQNYILEKIDDYYLFRIEDPVCLQYHLQMEKQEEKIIMGFILEKIQKLEEENKKLNNKIQRFDKITNELLLENRILREYVPVINKTIFSIQKEINDANKLKEDEKEMIRKLFKGIRDEIVSLESHEEEIKNNILHERISYCESSVQNIKKITDNNMISILREIDNIYSIIENSKRIIFGRIGNCEEILEKQQITTIYNEIL